MEWLAKELDDLAPDVEDDLRKGNLVVQLESAYPLETVLIEYCGAKDVQELVCWANDLAGQEVGDFPAYGIEKVIQFQIVPNASGSLDAVVLVEVSKYM